MGLNAMYTRDRIARAGKVRSFWGLNYTLYLVVDEATHRAGMAQGRFNFILVIYMFLVK